MHQMNYFVLEKECLCCSTFVASTISLIAFFFFSSLLHYLSADMWLILTGLKMDDSLLTLGEPPRKGASSYLSYLYLPHLIIIVA